MQNAAATEDAIFAEDFSRIRETQIDNVIRLIKSSIERIKMSLILPKLGDDMDHMRNVLKSTIYSPAIALMEKLQSLDTVKVQILNHEVIRIIDYFHTNFQIYELFPRLVNLLSNEDKKLIVACETILAVAQRHLWRTAKSEISMERQLHVMYHEREEIRSRTAYYQKRLKSRNAILRWKQAVKFLILEKLETDLANRKWKNSVRIQNEIEQRSRILRDVHKNTVQKQKDLEEELEKAKLEYEHLITSITLNEKDARAEKNKLLIQLEGILQKFDTNIGEKIRENLELEDQYKVAKKELDIFMISYRKEEAVYNKIVVQYEQEEQRKQQQRILLFMMNRAARQIQKYWLKWRRDQRLKARRQNRKKKK
ncbi:uncharacterized protein LOC117566768 [Drosophila albomicans]|uniref:Dynein regulatory complex protein 10 n=1 Tax=Drosophila albomicans TaxID=7291 RepID=A0A6P8XXX6_DROAB|nr:uncharacterized protein LOC117566768 [Drosophila albomicans]